MLHRFLRKPEIGKIVAADKNEKLGRARTNTALLSALYDGFTPDVEFVPMDLYDVEATAKRIKDIGPDMIVACPSLMSWWVFAAELPKEVTARVAEAGFGPWLPMHLMLMYKLMQAVKRSGLRVGVDLHVVSTPYPDAVNVVLNKIGLAPTCGIGNIAEIISYVRLSVSQKLKVPVSNVTAYCVGHHSVEVSVFEHHSTQGIPNFLKVYVGGEPVPENKLKTEEIVSLPFPVNAGHEAHPITIASAMPVIMGIWNDTGELCHATGPNGLPGGYPVRASASGVEVCLPQGITMKEAIRINEEGAKADGIEEIRNDGTAVWTKKATEIMKEVLGYDCKPMRPDEIEKRAAELGNAYTSLLTKHGVKHTALRL